MYMATHSITLTKLIKASPEKVFKAFIEKEQLEEWYAPGPMKAEFRVFEPKVGGSFEIAMISPEGKEHISQGVFKEIVMPTKLVHTWQWVSPDEGAETLVTVEFKEVSEGTEIVFVHENFAEEENAQHHKKGWASILDKLEKRFA